MIVGNIDTKDISVVVQGAIDEKYTSDCLKSIRKYLPDSEIILSTWEGSNVNNLDYDILVLSKDPGFSLSAWVLNAKPNNTNRQILSTINGLKKVNKKYSLKFRTDFILTGNNFLKYFYKFHKYEEEYKIFNNKLLACCYFSINPNKYKRTYHVGDFCFFGYTSDLINLFDIDLAKLDELYYDEYLNFKYTPEQYIFIKCLEKNGKKVKSKCFNDVNNESIIETEKYFASNFILLNINEYNIKLPDKNIIFHFNLNDINNELFKSCYTHIEWQQLYKKHADNKHKVSSYDKERKILENNYKKYIASKNNKNNILENIFSIKKYNDKTIITICFIKITIKTNIYKKISKIQSKDVSVIVQGAIDQKYTANCLKSIRKYLPDSEIILSTWENSNVDGLDYDVLVFNKDPGSNDLIRKYPHPHINNINRQIVSSNNGFCKASRKYGLKLRSDMILTGNVFLQYYSKFKDDITSNSFFTQRILVNNLASIYSPYNVGDWWVFGLTKDLKEFYNIPLYDYKINKEYFFEENNYYKRPKFADIVTRYIPETWIIIQNILKYKKDVHFLHHYDVNELNTKINIDFITNNLICLEEQLSNIVLCKATNMNNPAIYKYCISFIKWYSLCIENKINLTKLNLIKLNSLKWQDKLRINKFSNFWYLKNYIYIVKNYFKYTNIKEYQNHFDISNKDITFIIYDKSKDINLYKEYLLHIKQHFSESKIILCLDKEIDSNTLEGLYNKIIVKENDLMYEYDKKESYIKKALELVETQYVIKTSLECTFDQKIINIYKEYLNKFNKYDINYTIFEQKILISQYMTIDAKVTPNFINPYSFSTIFQFGLTNDIKKIWNGYKISEKYLDQNKNIKYTEEQITIRNVLEQTEICKNIMFPEYNSDSTRDEYIFDSEKILSNNFIIAEQNQIKIQNIEMSNLIFVSFYRYLEIYLLNIDPANEELLKLLEYIYNKNNHINIFNKAFNIEYKENKKIITLF
ncbi:WavE lipopolysaccharide synthesis family protein, partial [Brachyspira intermedia]|uniref:WavE lipopolysaccharide synthesis family protein n=1 Tax=Brachyspira intermedia TaxID=84377 RepID=UPI00300579BE